MQHNRSHSTISLDIQFRHMPKIAVLQLIAQQQLDSFNRFTSGAAHCHIVFDRSHSSKNGPIYRVAIRLHIPGQPLYVAHSSESGGSQELLFSTLNNAFSDLRRQVTKARTKRNQYRHLAA